MIERAPNHISKSGNQFTQWVCKCDCGKIRVVFTSSLKNGRSTSCGCLAKSKAAEIAKINFKTHGDTKTRLYQIWSGIKKRCNNENAYNYKNYGGRGIKICNEWNEYLGFRTWALDNGYNDSLSIDRIDVDGDYTPDNCRWVDIVTQNNNRRSNIYYTLCGEKLTLADISRKYNYPYKQLHKKIKSGKKIEDILKLN